MSGQEGMEQRAEIYLCNWFIYIFWGSLRRDPWAFCRGSSDCPEEIRLQAGRLAAI